jgi:hypothetical protein
MSTLNEKLFKLQRRPVPGRHHITIIETEAPGALQILCSCGETCWTPWGEAHAAEITALHLWAVGAVNLVKT